MVEDSERLRQEALKARRLARGVADQRVRAELIALAKANEERAGPGGPHLATSGAEDAEKNKPDVNADSPSKP